MKCVKKDEVIEVRISVPDLRTNAFPSSRTVPGMRFEGSIPSTCTPVITLSIMLSRN